MSDLFSELLESLQDLPVDKDYTAQDRYTDFRQLFMGSDQGKRVYRQLLSWGGMFSTSIHGSPIDANKVLVSEGMRNYAIRLMAAVNIDPPQKPTKSTKKPTRSTSTKLRTLK